MNGDLNTMFRIPIPLVDAIRMPKETHFRVMDRDLRTQKGTITRAWNVGSSSYTNNIYFAEPELDVELKTLYLGAAFLLVSVQKIFRCFFLLKLIISNSILGIYLLSIEVLLIFLD